MPQLGATVSALLHRRRLARELEQAQRLGYWFTDEDRALVREHEAKLAAERRSSQLGRLARQGSVVLLLAACVQPLLWPLALIGAVKAFPRTSRRLGYGVLALGAAMLVGAGLLAVQVGRSLLAPPVAPALPPAGLGASPSLQALGPAVADPGSVMRGREIAVRLNQDCDYWVFAGASPDGTPTYRKGLFQRLDGQLVMALPRSTWAALTERQRRDLASHLAVDRGIGAIQVGRLVPASGFAGQRLQLEERVWP